MMRLSWRRRSSQADNKVNIQNISTSEIKISCIITKEQGAKALQVVHDAFELEKMK